LAVTGKSDEAVTFLGGSGNDCALPIAVDSGGNAYITGDTTSANFPITANAAQASALGAYAAFCVAVENQIDAGIEVAIADAGIGVDVRPPVCEVGAEEVVCPGGMGIIWGRADREGHCDAAGGMKNGDCARL